MNVRCTGRFSGDSAARTSQFGTTGALPPTYTRSSVLPGPELGMRRHRCRVLPEPSIPPSNDLRTDLRRCYVASRNADSPA